MIDSMHLIQQRVLQIHCRKQLLDVNAIAEELEEHCSGMTLDEIKRVISDHVATIGASAKWRKSRAWPWDE